MKRYLRKISDPGIVGRFSASGLGFAAILLVVGCGDAQQSSTSSNLQQATQNGATVMIEKQQDGSYKIIEEYPSSSTRVFLKEADGTERILSKEEIDAILAQESKKIDNGTSELTNPTGGGLSLGETILASAAGAILGSYIGSKLFNNQNYQAQQRASYKSPQAYERSQNSFRSNSANAGRSGFFSPKDSTSTNRSSNLGG